MAFSDWEVVINSETDLIDVSRGGINNVPLFPPNFVIGKTVSITFTHIPSGVILERVDKFMPYTEDAVKKYVRDVIVNYESKIDAARFSAVGRLDISIPPVVDPRSEAEVKLATYQNLVRNYDAKVILFEKLKQDDPSSAVELDAKLAADRTAIEQLAKEVTGAIINDEVVPVIGSILRP